jgi:hypothetical protein
VILSWVLKILLSIALVGLVGFEIGSPLITKAQVDDTAHLAADEAAIEMFASKDAEAARAAAVEVVAKKVGMSLDRFTLSQTGTVEVVVSKKAKSLLLDRFDQTDQWYDIQVTATSTRTTR